MFSAMDAEHPMDLDSRGTHVRKLSLHSIGPERYVGIADTFQHLILHSFITIATSTVAAGGFNQNFSPYSVRCRIEANGPALQVE